METPYILETIVDQHERYIRQHFQIRRVTNPLHRPNSRMQPPTYLEICWEGHWERLNVWRRELIFNQTAKEFGLLFNSKLFRSYLKSSAIPFYSSFSFLLSLLIY